MVLDLEERCATFYAIPYDLGSTRRALRQYGLPPKAYHLRPSFKRAARRAFRYFAGDRASRQPTRVE
jgi:hypothetical protein